MQMTLRLFLLLGIMLPMGACAHGEDSHFQAAACPFGAETMKDARVDNLSIAYTGVHGMFARHKNCPNTLFSVAVANADEMLKTEQGRKFLIGRSQPGYHVVSARIDYLPKSTGAKAEILLKEIFSYRQDLDTGNMPIISR